MKRAWPIAAIVVLAIGFGLWFSSKDDSTGATPATGASASAAAPDALSKARLDEIEATINKQEPESDKLKSQASLLVSVLRENFIKKGTPIENVTIGDTPDSINTRSAQVSATGASGTTYRLTLVYVADPTAGGEFQWLILYVEG
jgi:hypothetical protein